MTRPRGAARLAVLLAIVVGGLVSLPRPAAAETTIEVTTPADGHYQAGSATPLLVTIKADRAITGTLSASFDGIFAGSQKVEVPGGSAKQVVFVVTTPPWSSSGQISFDGEGKGDDASARLNLVPAGADELVAILPSLTTGRDVPASAELSVAVGLARLYPFDPDLLDAGAEVLSPFSQVVATAEDLDALPPNQLDALQSWVGTSGGTLVIDADPASSLPFDVEPVPGTADGSSTFGLGQIRFTDGQAGAAGYDGLLGPTVPHDLNEFPFTNQFGSVPTSVLLAADAGVRIPAIGALVALLVLYTVVAGPILWLVLRRQRRETMVWALLPALALVTTLAVYGMGRALRHDSSTAHATIVADLPATRILSSEVLVTAPAGGPAGVDLSAGWRPVSSVSEQAFFGFPNQGANSQQRLDDTRLVTDLPSGGVGVVNAETTLPAAQPSWEFDLRPTERGLAGTITNRSGVTLSEIYVSSGQGFQRVASLDADESAEVTLNGSNVPVISSDPMTERLMGGDPWSANDGVVNPGSLANWLGRRPTLRTPGFVLAVGWTRDQPSPLRTTRGQAVTNGRTAYLTAERVDPGGTGRAQGRLELVRGTSTRVTDTFQRDDCGDTAATARVTPPSGSRDLVLEVPSRSILAMDVWRDDAWIPTGLGQLDRTGKTVFDLSAQPDDDGPMYLRIQFSCDFWSTADPFPVLRARADDDQTVAIAGPADEEAAGGANA